jgi:ribonuclease P protein component
MTIYLVKGPGNEHNLRIGFIISKKTGKAVLRNKVKRVIKETLKEVDREVCCSLDILFKINNNICNIDLKELKTKVIDIIELCLTDNI